MVHFSPERLDSLLQNARGKKIMVIGDMMVDRYLWGTVTRLSPEAPVPIINIEDEDIRFGGAANVANNIISLGAEPIVVGVIGKDFWGLRFKSMLEERNLTSDGLIVEANRPTTIKTRIIGNNQHIARVDREKTYPIQKETVQKIIRFVESQLPVLDAIILQDYNKGVLTPELITAIVELANNHGIIVTVDPKFHNFMSYKRVTLFKPNRRETEEALATRLTTRDEIIAAGNRLLTALEAQAVLITLGEKGMALFQRQEEPVFMVTRARKVADVSGAGDTVIASVTVTLSAGATMEEAVVLSNYAAGVVCEEVGVVPITVEALKKTVVANQAFFNQIDQKQPDQSDDA